MVLQCPKKVYNYCKKTGHVIKECPIHPPRKTRAGYVAAATLASISMMPAAIIQVLISPNPIQNFITPEMIQQMVISTLSTLGVSGKLQTVLSP